ncbi:acetolactate decarboxylase [Herbiconiux sp.]|uniref:acetolactate decarboxylase n=1 Tax=Herbiconiux sp. TaxID=1871186 RepID=UPI0025BD22B9|nr:acetolactate decarboxylase [Herbiconiux sp.]
MRRKHARKVLEQFSLVDALVAGLFDGVFSLEEVSRAGTLGLGCGDHMDGELVLHEGVWRQFHGDGSVSVLGAADTVPFAEVVDFDPDRTELIEAVPGFEALAAEIAALVPSPNLFHAVRFDAHFASISLREAVRQEKPYLPLAQAVHTQREIVLSDVSGTLLGFVAPQVFQGVTVAGPHFHFVDESGQQGGHVLGLTGATGELAVETYYGVTVHLPGSPDYLAAELDPEGADAAIRHAESDHQH